MHAFNGLLEPATGASGSALVAAGNNASHARRVMMESPLKVNLLAGDGLRRAFPQPRPLLDAARIQSTSTEGMS